MYIRASEAIKAYGAGREEPDPTGARAKLVELTCRARPKQTWKGKFEAHAKSKGFVDQG